MRMWIIIVLIAVGLPAAAFAETSHALRFDLAVYQRLASDRLGFAESLGAHCALGQGEEAVDALARHAGASDAALKSALAEINAAAYRDALQAFDKSYAAFLAGEAAVPVEARRALRAAGGLHPVDFCLTAFTAMIVRRSFSTYLSAERLSDRRAFDFASGFRNGFADPSAYARYRAVPDAYLQQITEACVANRGKQADCLVAGALQGVRIRTFLAENAQNNQ